MREDKWEGKLFSDREEAGKALVKRLSYYKRENPVVIALPRGGVPVGYQVAKYLRAPLDIIVVRKIGSVYEPEFGIGAIAEGNVMILDESLIKSLNISRSDLENSIKKEKEELLRRVALYKAEKGLPNLRNKTVILVDDGLATGITAQAAVKAIKKLKAKKIIVAFPVCSVDVKRKLETQVDRVICLSTPRNFMSVGSWYWNFKPTTDEEVVHLLQDLWSF